MENEVLESIGGRVELWQGVVGLCAAVTPDEPAAVAGRPQNPLLAKVLRGLQGAIGSA